MSWIHDMLLGAVAADAGDAIAKARRPWLRGAAMVGAILLLAVLLRLLLG